MKKSLVKLLMVGGLCLTAVPASAQGLPRPTCGPEGSGLPKCKPGSVGLSLTVTAALPRVESDTGQACDLAIEPAFGNFRWLMACQPSLTPGAFCTVLK